MSKVEQEPEMSKNKSSLFGDGLEGLFETGLKLAAASQGGAGGLAIVNALFAANRGQDPLQAGIGAFANAAAIGPTGAAILQGMGGGGRSVGSAEQGLGQFLNTMSSTKGQNRVMNNAILASLAGGKERGLEIFVQSVLDPDLNLDAPSVMREHLNEQRTVKFDKVLSPTEMRQFDTGERRPDYTGAILPDTPRVRVVREGGMIEGPGTGTSDSIPAAIYQNGGRVQEAALSDGEFVMTADAVKGAGGGNRDAGAAKMYQMMNQFERRA
tara:strand:+ start:50 stop:856 length:807 start_codon:yes stop_codon:yes gene_type:complete